MAKAKFIGTVRGYSTDDNGDVHLTIDDTELSEAARFFAHDLEKSFNPNSPAHGYGAKDVPCTIRPGLGSYYFTLPADQCRNITYGSLVEVEYDLFMARKVRFFKNRWGTINELRHDLISIRPAQESRQPEAKARDAESGGKPGNK